MPEIRSTPTPPSTGGRLVYAVGDVHGYAAALKALLADIARDAEASRPAETPLLVFVGDYVDRGPDSRGVIDLILETEASGRFEVVALKGNHEDALLRFLEEPAYASSWIGNWGETTIISYGIVPPEPHDTAACERAQARFAAAFPEGHRAFLGRLALQQTVGDYLFVHAGVRPGVALDAQIPRDLMWIRYDFLECADDFGKVVVHGHTPSAGRPEIKANRINIDTGVYFTGLLTAVRLEGETRRFIQAGV
ncbi:MAG: serine/threonine protein phosphatase [Phenylobacterium sp.]|uniref:metallophosphoesterase family protein n=1 Tax=Phenylobacterium sp. TaxID=1871053 RepID=UPI001A38562C|nr:metallophosphoesterase family protein [Phenylobacterium sp.]MBL8555993.1 serine/threonine protein phosphatase [Phenylobacterium sp.]